MKYYYNSSTYPITRYSTLAEPCQIRRDNLEDALQLYQFYRDLAGEMSWIEEKRPIAGSTDLGNSLTAVQNLQKKHMVSDIRGLFLETFGLNLSSCVNKITQPHNPRFPFTKR